MSSRNSVCAKNRFGAQIKNWCGRVTKKEKLLKLFTNEAKKGLEMDNIWIKRRLENGLESSTKIKRRTKIAFKKKFCPKLSLFLKKLILV